MTGLAEIFTELGISHYLHDFIEQGFDSWDTILDITESDFDALGVKLGHRRRLQRKIANSRGVSSDIALTSPIGAGSSDGQVDEQKGGAGRGDVKEGGSGPHGAKRKYRRHPRPDDNAPERPPSAYVIFSNKMREDLKGRNLSFTEIAKLVGENWQNLSPAEKEPYEHQAFTAKERYNNELSEYKKTQNYKDYSQYLAEFKQKQNQQLMSEMDVAKRPKLEPHASTASSGTASSAGSQHSGETMIGRNRLSSSASSMSSWNPVTAQPTQLTSVPTLPTLATLTKASSVPGRQSQASPTHSTSILPGYRESMLGSGSQNWREGRREDAAILQPIQRIADMSERRRSQSGPAMPDHLGLNGPRQPHLRSQRSSQPPLLSTESTNQSSSSSTSNSSTFYNPQTPMEPNFDRALPIPAFLSQKSGGYDGSIPYLPAPSLSPQSSMLGAQHSLNDMNSTVDLPIAMPPMRRYSEAPLSLSNSFIKAESPDTRPHDYVSTIEEDQLDPVSALIRAGEIVDRSSRGEKR